MKNLITFIAICYQSVLIAQNDTIIKRWENDYPRIVSYYVNNKLKYVEYYNNGKIESEKFYLFLGKEPIKDSIWTWYHENGNKKAQITSYGGKQNGLSQEWYENGQLKSRGIFKDGEEEGLWEYWYENGKRKISIETKNGKNNGKVTKWDEEGNLIGEYYFKDGVEVDSGR